MPMWATLGAPGRVIANVQRSTLLVSGSCRIVPWVMPGEFERVVFILYQADAIMFSGMPAPAWLAVASPGRRDQGLDT